VSSIAGAAGASFAGLSLICDLSMAGANPAFGLRSQEPLSEPTLAREGCTPLESNFSARGWVCTRAARACFEKSRFRATGASCSTGGMAARTVCLAPWPALVNPKPSTLAQHQPLPLIDRSEEPGVVLYRVVCCLGGLRRVRGAAFLDSGRGDQETGPGTHALRNSALWTPRGTWLGWKREPTLTPPIEMGPGKRSGCP